MQFLAQIQGGIGPDVWDKEVFIDAADFLDAAQQVSAKADDIGGQVTLLEQCDCSEAEALDRAVNRFLTWPLPNTVSADHCERESDAQGRCAQHRSPVAPIGVPLGRRVSTDTE